MNLAQIRRNQQCQNRQTILILKSISHNQKMVRSKLMDLQSSQDQKAVRTRVVRGTKIKIMMIQNLLKRIKIVTVIRQKKSREKKKRSRRRRKRRKAEKRRREAEEG